MRRSTFSVWPLVVIAALVLFGASGCGVRTAADAPTERRPAVSTPSVEATAPPQVQTLEVSRFGPSKAPWRTLVKSLTVRGDTLAIVVSRPLTRAEAEQIAKAAEVARAAYRLNVKHYAISSAVNGYLLSYGPLR